jgi:hypothetical protein
MPDPIDPSRLPEYLAKLSFEERKETDPSLHGNQSAQDAYWGATQVLSSLKAGDMDPWLGLRIDTIIRKSTRYLIYLDPNLDLQWFWLTRPDESAVGLVQARIGQLTKESAFLLVGRSKWLRRYTHRSSATGADQAPLIASPENRYLAKKIRCVMGEALALALTGSSEAACEAVLDEAKRYIAVAKDQYTRPVFVTAFLLVVGLFSGALGCWICWFASCCAAHVDHRFVTGWLEAAVAGSAGALLSALLRTRDLGLEPAAGIKGITFEAIARALIGAGSGILVGFAFDSGIILKGAIQGADTSRILRLFFCVASGASERILPALVGRAESLIGSDAKTQTSDGNDTRGPGKPPDSGSRSGPGAPEGAASTGAPLAGQGVPAPQTTAGIAGSHAAPTAPSTPA